jgi:CelD/BcsL family acetyltransferase involved in cellulose biosynthesis
VARPYSRRLPLDALLPEEAGLVRQVAPESAAWAELARSAPGAGVFHQPEWAEVIRRTYGLSPAYLLLPRAARPASGLPFFEASRLLRRRLISLPFSDVAGPLLSRPEDLAPLMAAASDAARAGGIGQIEVRGGAGPLPAGFARSDEFCSFMVELGGDLSALRRSFQKSTTQRCLRHAERSPLTVRLGQSQADMAAFHRLNLITRRRHGVPPQPYRLFRNIWEVMAPAGLMTLLLACLEAVPVAGMVLFHFRDTAYYKYGASDMAHLKLRPNHLLMWRAMEWAAEHGYRRLDLGRTHRANDGLMRYKSSWAATQVCLPYWHSPPAGGRGALSEGSRSYRFMTGCWRHLPLWATEVGSLFYKHFA